MSYSARDRPRASELRQDASYQSILRSGPPYLLSLDNRQQNQNVVSEQYQASLSQQQTFDRILSSSCRRTVPSSVV